MPLSATIVTVVLAVLLMGGGGRLLSITAKAGDEIPAAIGVGDTSQFIGHAWDRVSYLGSNPMDVVFRAFYALLSDRVSSEEPKSSASSEAGKKEPGFWDKFNPGVWWAYTVKWIYDFYYAIYALLIKFVFFLLFLVAILIGAILQFLMNGARFLAMAIGSGLMPLFIGMVGWERSAGIGRTYLVQLMAICFWPIGWAVGHIISLELIDVSLKSVSAGGVKAGVDERFAAAMSGQGLSPADIENIYSILYSAGGSIETLMGIILVLLTIIWLIASPITVALAMSKTLTTGSEFVAGALGSTAMSTARVAGKVAKAI
jgi:hypothetical protein